MKVITVKVKVLVKDEVASSFHLDLIKRMNKYLSNWAATVYAVDSSINEKGEDND